MQKLIVTRGCPGCGKSTWIKSHGLEPYTLCPDVIRLMCTEPIKDESGALRISQNDEMFVWKMLSLFLINRMKHGYLTCIDATCSRLKDLKWYQDLAKQYNYELIVVDFTKVSLSTCLTQNEMRESIKYVPREVIEKYVQRFESQKGQLPQDIKIVDFDEFVLDM